MNKQVWKKLLEFAGKGKGLGAYINRHLKQMVDGNDYYELITPGIE